MPNADRPEPSDADDRKGGWDQVRHEEPEQVGVRCRTRGMGDELLWWWFNWGQNIARIGERPNLDLDLLEFSLPSTHIWNDGSTRLCFS